MKNLKKILAILACLALLVFVGIRVPGLLSLPGIEGDAPSPVQPGEEEDPLVEPAPEAAEQILDGLHDIDEAWVMGKIEEHRDQIEENDLETGLRILDEVDAEYFYQLSEGGYTEEEKVLVMERVQESLSQEDIDTMWMLFHKYEELVQ